MHSKLQQCPLDMRVTIACFEAPLASCFASTAKSHCATVGISHASAVPRPRQALTEHCAGCIESAYLFPGIGLGTLVSRATRLREDMLLAAAEALAAAVTDGAGLSLLCASAQA